MKFFILIFAILIACEEEVESVCDKISTKYDILPLYIDSQCHENHIEQITKAVEKINSLSRSYICQDLIDVQFLVDVNHVRKRLEENTIACYYEEPEWFSTSMFKSFLGSSQYEYDARLFIFKIPEISDRYLFAIALHELFHYVGVKKHAEYSSSVMYHSISAKNLNFTTEDIDLFCDVFDCVY